MIWSIIICCYNSESKIQKTLENLLTAIPYQPDKFEILVIDNASTDKTYSKVLSVLKNIKDLNFTVIKEPQAGLVHARKAGVNNSRGKYISFIDDDNWVLNNYFQIAEKVFQNNNIGIFGCSSKLPDSVVAPKLIKPYLLSFAVGELYTTTGILPIGCTIWGAGLSIKSTIAKKIFNDDCPLLMTGRAGSKQLAGDDTEICYRTLDLNYRIWYQNDTLIEHAISQDRLTKASIIKMNEGFGLSSLILMRYKFFSQKKFFYAQNAFFVIGVIKIIIDIILIPLTWSHKNSLDTQIKLSKVKFKIIALLLNKKLYDLQSIYFKKRMSNDCP